MKKYLSIVIVVFLIILCGCDSNSYSGGVVSAKAFDGVPDEVVDEFMNGQYNYKQLAFKNEPGRESKPTYSNEINIYQREDTMVGADTFLVNLKATISSEICTREVELQCKYQFQEGGWRLVNTNKIIDASEWHYSNFRDCWWVGGAGLNYRAFYITEINSEKKTMKIIDSSDREYLTDYEVFDDYIAINVKYDTARWIIYPEGPWFNGYFMTKN